MDVSSFHQQQPPQNAVFWPTDWMHRQRMQFTNTKHQSSGPASPIPPTLASTAASSAAASAATALFSSSETKKLSSSSSSSTSGNVMKPYRTSPTPTRVSSGQLVAYTGRRHCSPGRKLQRQSPQPRRCCQPGPTPSPDFAEWNRTIHDTTYRTYKALPRSSRPFGLQDFALLREIFALAETLAQPGAEVKLTDVLRAYDIVLQNHGMDAEDTFYYRMLLKLSLRSEKSWWDRLNKEILKNDILMKVNSFRSHKLLLCYWLQWRCHHEKGILRGLKKGQGSKVENLRGFNMLIAHADNSLVTPMTTSHSQKMEDGVDTMADLSMVPIHSEMFPMKDTLLVMDLVELPVDNKESFSRIHIKQIAAAFQVWQRVARQRRKKRSTKDKSARQWRLALSFNSKRVISEAWELWQHLSSKRLIEANQWYKTSLMHKCISLWSNHCVLLRELCKAGENLYKRRFCLLVFAEWKDYTSFMKMSHRALFRSRRFLSVWRSRLSCSTQQKAVLFQCQKIHQIHVLSSGFQGWHAYCNATVKYRTQAGICREVRSHRVQLSLLQKWRVWIHYKHSLEQVLSFGVSWRKRFIQREAFNAWLQWWQKKQLLEICFSKIVLSVQRRLSYMSTKQCQKTLICWRKWASKKKHERKTLLGITRFSQNRRKIQSWHRWCEQYGYQAAVTRWHSHRDHKTVSAIFRAFRILAKESRERRNIFRKPLLCGQVEDYHIHSEGVAISHSCPNRRLVHELLHSTRGAIRKWKYLIEIRHINIKGLKRDLAVKLWSRFWLKTAIEGWKIVVQKRKCEKKLSESLKQLWAKERHPWASKKLACLQAKTLHGRRTDGKRALVAARWRGLVLEKLSFSTWAHIYAIQREQVKQELFALQKLKNWWLTTMLSLWKTLAYRYSREQENLYQNDWLVFDNESDDKHQITKLNAIKSANTAPRSATFKCQYQVLRVLKDYGHQQKVVQGFLARRRPGCVISYLNKWRQRTRELKSEQPSLLMIKEHIKKLPKCSQIMGNLLSVCPRWVVCKSFEIWREWSRISVLKRKYNRMALEHLATVLNRKAFLSLQKALIDAHTVRISRKRSEVRTQVEFMRQHRRMTGLYQKFHIWVSYVHKKKYLRAAQEMHRRRRLKLCIYAWLSRVGRLKFKREAEETIMNNLFKKFCQTAFLVWQDVTVMARHARKTETLAVNKIQHSRITFVFFKWREVVKHAKCIAELTNVNLARHKHKFFHAWFENVKQHERRTMSHNSIIRMRKHQCTRKILRMWQEKTFKIKQEREGNSQASIFRYQCVVLRVFKRLKCWMHDRQMKEGFSLLACGKLQQVCMKRAFNAWLRQAGIHSKRRTVFIQLKQAFNKNLLARTLNQMQEVVLENWHLRGNAMKAFKMNLEAIKLNKVESLHRRRLFCSLFQHWRERCAFHIALHQTEKMFRFNFLQRAFHKWRTFIEHMIELQALEKELSLSHSMVLQKQYWLQWQFRTEEVQYQQQFLLFKTFRAWIKYAKWKDFWRCMEQDATYMLLQTLQKRALWAWQSLVREITIRREEHQQQRFLQREAMVLATRTERREKVELLYTVFKLWRAKSQQALDISSFINKRKHHIEGLIWSEWMSLAGKSNLARQIKCQRLKSIGCSALNSWHEACHKHSMENENREAEAAKFASWKCIHVAWLQWASYVAFCKERVKALEECLVLIQTRQFCESVRDMVRAWKDYTSEREKRREHCWTAEASYKRHKLADYFTAWHHYTAATKDSASSLRGTIQVYKQRGSHYLQPMVGARYRFSQGFGHISPYGNGDIKFHSIAAPSVVIEEVNSSVEESDGPSHSNPRVSIENEGIHANCNTASYCFGPPPRLLENGPLWSQVRPTESLNLEAGEDFDDWPFNDLDGQTTT